MAEIFKGGMRTGDSNKLVTCFLDAPFRPHVVCARLPPIQDFKNGRPKRSFAKFVLARSLAHTGLGPTRGRKLVQYFGTPDAIFHASLTDLEATGMLAISAQSIATGSSLSKAEEEFAKAVISGLARGVDTAARRGAVNAKGKTIAVFGTGVDWAAR
jgi:predicted Rossmann fold nucleotide-binding protein DprA/Smf involved in DNA uptake